MHKKVLYINLETQEYDIKSVTELNKYIGGVGIGLKLLQENMPEDPVIFSIGPFNGFFPYASKTSIVFHSGTAVEDIYLGGSLSLRLKFTGVDALVITGKSTEQIILDIQDEEVFFRPVETEIDSLGLPGKRSIIKLIKGKFFLDEYFLTAEDLLEDKLIKKNVRGLVITGTKTFELANKDKYTELFNKLLEKTDEITVEKGTYPSCAGCPMGCSKSRIGEIGGNLLVHSLVACTYSKNIYSSIGVVFSCLNVLGYDYTHEDIEQLPALIEQVLKEIS